MTYSKAAEKHIKHAGWWQTLSICLGFVAFATLLFAAFCQTYGELYYWMPSGNNPLFILLFGLLVAIFSHQLNEKGTRLADKAEIYALYASQEKVEVRLEKVIVKALADYHLSDKKPLNFQNLETFVELQRALKQLCEDLHISIEETDQAVARSLHKVANMDALSGALDIEPFMNVAELRAKPIAELIEGLKLQLDGFAQQAVEEPESGAEVVQQLLYLLQLRTTLAPVRDSVVAGATPTVVALKQRANR